LLFFRFLADSGLRIGEAVALRWGDVDVDAGLVHVRRRLYRGRIDRTKTKYGRRKARISDDVAGKLRTLRAGRADDELVFPNGVGRYLNPGNVMSRVLKPAAVKAGLGVWVIANGRKRAESWVGFHTFRHTCATALFESGWNVKQVQLQLAHHKPPFTLDTYIHLMPGDLPAHPRSMAGNRLATRPAENARNELRRLTPKTPQTPETPRQREASAAES
jgi:integrase